jgi:hypothetical protein
MRVQVSIVYDELWIVLTYSFPLNSVLPVSSSANIQPMRVGQTACQSSPRRDTHLLTTCRLRCPEVSLSCERGHQHQADVLAVPYRLSESTNQYLHHLATKADYAHRKASMISGARYHRVATYSVICVPESSDLSSKPRLRPKSQILSSQSALTRRLPGLRSRWTTPAV